MKLVFVFGTRPEVIKLAPVIVKAIEEGCRVKIIAVGQHTDLLEQAMYDFGLRPTVKIKIPETSSDKRLVDSAADAIKGIGDYLNPKIHDYVVVQGDTITTYAGAVAGYLTGVKVVHVEAGLRTYNLAHPYPEEGLRQMVSRIAYLNCCPTKQSVENLKMEKLGKNPVYVGNTIVDAIEISTSRFKDTQNHVLVTLHRRENGFEELDRIVVAIKAWAMLHPDWSITFPCHPSPRIRKAISPLKHLDNVEVINPVSYMTCLDLIKKSKFVVTDSGGIQEEAGILGVPVIVCRETTERPESVEEGASVLCGSDTDEIANMMELWSNDFKRSKHEIKVKGYGDGKASERILEFMRSYQDAK